MIMLVCLCTGLTENDLVESIEQSDSIIQHINNVTGGTACGMCFPLIVQIIQEKNKVKRD